jgi:hypothetical protein
LDSENGYLVKTLRTTRAREFIEDVSRICKSVYVATGLIITRGATIANVQSDRGIEASIKTDYDVTPVVELRTSKLGNGDVVVAYQLRKSKQRYIKSILRTAQEVESPCHTSARYFKHVRFNNK